MEKQDIEQQVSYLDTKRLPVAEIDLKTKGKNIGR